MTAASTPGSIVVVAGPPGAGKTTVSRLVRSFSRAAAVLAQGGYGVILDGIVGPWNLHLVTGEAAAVGAEVHYAVLRPSLAVALMRATARTGEERVPGRPALTDEEPIRKMWHEFAGLGDYERHVVDSTALDADQTAAGVCTLLDAGLLRV